MAWRARFAMLVAVLFIVGCEPKPRVETNRLAVREVRRTPLASEIARHEIVDIDWATDSLLFSTIEGGEELALFGWDGSLARRVARKGEGPGEVSFALHVLRATDASLKAIDVRQFKVKTWSIDGELQSDVRFPAALATGAWDTDEGLVLRTDAGNGEMRFDLLSDPGASLRRASFASRPSRAETSCSYCPTAVAMDGTIAMATSDTSYRILRASREGAALPPIERADLAAIPLSESEADSIVEVYDAMADKIVQRSGLRSGAERLRAAGRMRAFKPRFTGRFSFDERSMLWVQRNVANGDSAAVDVFDRDAKLLGEFRLPPGVVMYRARHGNVLGMFLTDEGETVVAEWTVNLAPP